MGPQEKMVVRDEALEATKSESREGQSKCERLVAWACCRGRKSSEPLEQRDAS